jgi:hypothetical protein
MLRSLMFPVVLVGLCFSMYLFTFLVSNWFRMGLMKGDVACGLQSQYLLYVMSVQLIANYD